MKGTVRILQGRIRSVVGRTCPGNHGVSPMPIWLARWYGFNLWFFFCLVNTSFAKVASVTRKAIALGRTLKEGGVTEVDSFP